MYIFFRFTITLGSIILLCMANYIYLAIKSILKFLILLLLIAILSGAIYIYILDNEQKSKI